MQAVINAAGNALQGLIRKKFVFLAPGDIAGQAEPDVEFTAFYANSVIGFSYQLYAVTLEKALDFLQVLCERALGNVEKVAELVQPDEILRVNEIFQYVLGHAPRALRQIAMLLRLTREAELLPENLIQNEQSIACTGF